MMNIILIIHTIYITIMLSLTIIHYHNAFHIQRKRNYQKGIFSQTIKVIQTKHFSIDSNFYQVGG